VLTLVGAIDDATGRVPAATFRDQEDAAGYLEILRTTIEAHGLPGALYHDRHGTFAPTSPGPAEPGVPPGLSQVGRALVELDIGSIAARSAQAKGRIERLWGTYQDRLVVELRLAGVVDRAGANAFLPAYLARFNARFGVLAVDPVPAWRPCRPGSGWTGCSCSSTAARSPGTTRSGSTDTPSSCRRAAAIAATPGDWSRSTQGSMARSWRSTRAASSPSAPRRLTPSSCGHSTGAGLIRRWCRKPLPCLGHHRPSTPGDESAREPSSIQQRLTESLNS